MAFFKHGSSTDNATQCGQILSIVSRALESSLQKKKNKEKTEIFDKIAKVENDSSIVEGKPKPVPLTKAERAFLKMKEKKQMERIIDKASKTHKQRVEDFNRHLDSLTEHYDIPKVSWTK